MQESGSSSDWLKEAKSNTTILWVPNSWRTLSRNFPAPVDDTGLVLSWSGTNRHMASFDLVVTRGKGTYNHGSLIVATSAKYHTRTRDLMTLRILTYLFVYHPVSNLAAIQAQVEISNGMRKPPTNGQPKYRTEFMLIVFDLKANHV